MARWALVRQLAALDGTRVTVDPLDAMTLANEVCRLYTTITLNLCDTYRTYVMIRTMSERFDVCGPITVTTSVDSTPVLMHLKATLLAPAAAPDKAPWTTGLTRQKGTILITIEIAIDRLVSIRYWDIRMGRVCILLAVSRAGGGLSSTLAAPVV